MSSVQTTGGQPSQPRKFFNNLGVIFGISVVCQSIAAAGIYGFSKSEWLNFAGPFPHPWYGYTVLDFFALLSFTIFGPVGFCLMYVVFQQLLRKFASHTTSTLHVTTLVASCLIIASISVFGWYWGWTLLQCGVIFCVNTDNHTWPSIPFEKPEAALGFKTTVGIPIVITATALIITSILAFFEHLKNSHYHRAHAEIYNQNKSHSAFNEPLLVSSSWEENPIPKNPMLKRYTPYNIHLVKGSADQLTSTSLSTGSTSQLSSSTPLSMPDSSDHVKRSAFARKYWIWFICYAMFLLFWWFVAGYVPNNWEYFYPARIAEKAKLLVTQNATECQSWRVYTCPEHEDGVIRTLGLSITKHLQIKIFPSNAFFYSFLFLFVFLAVCIKNSSESIEKFFATKIRVPRPWNSTPRDRIAFFTYAEFGALILTSIFVYLFTHYWFWDHNYNGYWPDEHDGYNIELSERVSRTLGQVAVFFFALLMFPAARNSPLLAMLGVSWEASIQYHRWLGGAFFVATMGHMFTTYWWYYVSGDLHDIYQIPQELPTSVDNFTVPIMQAFVWFSIISIGIMSLCWQQFRRKHFDVFMFFHHFTYLTMIPAILWHATASWEYILPAVTIWFFDRLVRAYRSVRAVNLVTAVQASTTTGEQYHSLNLFNPDSIDARVLTPQPITSIHHHSTYKDQQLYYQPFTSDDHNDNNNNTNNNNNNNNDDNLDAIPLSPSFVHSSSSLTNVSLNSPEPKSKPEGQQSQHHHHHQQHNQDNNNTKKSHFGSSLNVSGPGVRIVDRGEAGTYIELRIINDNMVYFPGHYAFINIAEISLFEWHPFTIASPAHFCARSEIVFIIKTMGPNTWTQSLYDYVKNYSKDFSPNEFFDIPLTVSLDGPYGTPIDFSTYDVVILLGGGIGITPCKSIYESLLLSYLHDFKSRLMHQQAQNVLNNVQSSALSEPNTNPLLSTLNVKTLPLVETNKRVHLMWSARDPRLFELMTESLSQTPYGPFSAQLFCDNPLLSAQEDDVLINDEKRKLNQNLVSLIRAGRPNMEHEFKLIVNGLNPNSYLSGSHDNGESTIALSAQVSTNGRPTGPVDPTSTKHGGFQNDNDKRVLVFVCGPDAMAKDAEIICQENGWDFHTETFAL